ncbi:MAG: Methyltransferase type 11 [Acidimicrobiaceae bacterium]|nr:Methyltransferase type 11 [Acidimicrobiaceae bacterium]
MAKSKVGAVLVGDLRRLLISLAAIARSPDNEVAYASEDAVGPLSRAHALQPPEKTILERLEPWLRDKRMLDVGVGGGRTTMHFADRVATYVAVDFSPQMIEACRATFSERADELSFLVADVRDLGAFEAESFDFVLFSYNGLDTVDDIDRQQALRELRRVCGGEGVFCFSSHNLCSLEQLFRLSDAQRANPYMAVRGLVQLGLLRLLNESPKVLTARSHALVRDGSLEFRLRHYYVRPSEQVRQLHAAGFAAVEIFGLDGRCIDLEVADQSRDAWLYYLAGRPSPSTSAV